MSRMLLIVEGNTLQSVSKECSLDDLPLHSSELKVLHGLIFRDKVRHVGIFAAVGPEHVPVGALFRIGDDDDPIANLKAGSTRLPGNKSQQSACKLSRVEGNGFCFLAESVLNLLNPGVRGIERYLLNTVAGSQMIVRQVQED